MAKYETVADIQREQRERLERAHRFETLTKLWSDSGRHVEKLDAQGQPIQRQITALQRVIDEANKLPNDVVHDAIGVLGPIAIPNGITRNTLVAVAGSALARLQGLDAQRRVHLADAAKRRDEAKAALDEEFPS